MLSDYLAKKLTQAKYKLLADNTYFGEIPGLKGVWANAKNLEVCREELQKVLGDWLLLKVSLGEKVPGLKIKSPRGVLVHA